MYEDLVKRLKHTASLYFALPTDGGDLSLTRLLSEAADIIEELSREYESVEASLTESVARVRKLRSPRWIPVTEQKPPLPEDEDVCYVQVIGAVKGKKEAEPVLYSRAYRLRDGKRVRIERFVGDGEVLEVTHWMLMPEPPEPPKEEAP